MSEPTFHEVLEEKYNLHDEMKCEGQFVRLYGTDKQAMELVTVGFTERAFIVAKLNLSDSYKDFDLQTLTPLPIIRVSIQNYEDKIISIRSQYKPIQIYQMCSCENQNDVWNSFVKFIEDIYRQEILEAAGDRKRITQKQDKEFIKKAVTSPTMSVNQYPVQPPKSVPNRNNSCNSSVVSSSPETKTMNKCPKEFEEFNKAYSMRTFDNLDWYPKFSFKTPRSPSKVIRNADLWSSLTNDDDLSPLIPEPSDDAEQEHGLWSRVKVTVRKATCCFPWLHF